MRRAESGRLGWSDAAVSLALAAGFLALAFWSLRHGIAAGKLGAAERAASPGTYWFIIGLQLVVGAAFLARGARIFEPRIRLNWVIIPGFGLVLILGAWMAVERAGDLLSIIRSAPDPGEKAVYALLALALLASLGAVFYQLIWLEIKDRVAGRGDED